MRTQIEEMDAKWSAFHKMTVDQRRASVLPRKLTPAIGRTGAEEERIYWAVVNQTDGFAKGKVE